LIQYVKRYYDQKKNSKRLQDEEPADSLNEQVIRDDSKLIPITYLDNFGLAMRETLMLKLTPYQMALLDTHMPYKKSFHIHFNHKHQIQWDEDRFQRHLNLFGLHFK